MKALEEELPASKFIRIHKSYIVSLASITSIRKNSVFIGLSEFPIGDSYKEALNQFISKAG
jgi:DNA-binding LytR/AlgR family response regulator